MRWGSREARAGSRVASGLEPRRGRIYPVPVEALPMNAPLHVSDQLPSRAAPTRALRPAIISLYALENNGVRHVSSSLRKAGFQVTEIYFKDWVNNSFPWPREEEVQALIELLREREIDVVGFSVRASALSWSGEIGPVPAAA